jgi:hypothetical protein
MGENIVISLGFSTTDLAKYNSATIFKQYLGKSSISGASNKNFASTVSGLNTFVNKPVPSLSWGYSSAAGASDLLSKIKNLAESEESKKAKALLIDSSVTQLIDNSRDFSMSKLRFLEPETDLKTDTLATILAKLSTYSPLKLPIVETPAKA